jgi:hypothetical protein
MDHGTIYDLAYQLISDILSQKDILLSVNRRVSHYREILNYLSIF